MNTYSKILVPLDTSSTAQTAADSAIALANALGAALRFITVMDFHGMFGRPTRIIGTNREDAQALLDNAVHRALQWELDVSAALIETNAQFPRVEDAITHHAQQWGADLIVIGSHGCSGVRRSLLGSVAQGVAHRSSVPVLIVHPQEHTQEQTVAGAQCMPRRTAHAVAQQPDF